MSRAATVVLAVLALALFASITQAKKPVSPSSYSVVTKDERFVFVMLVPPGMRSDEGAEGKELRKKYDQSGLYRNDGSREMLWTVDGYSWEAYPASDGVHLVCVSLFVHDGSSPPGPVLRLFAHGKPTGVYSADELTSFSLFLPQSPTGDVWLREDRFDEENLTYSVSTHDGKSFTFDVRTGEIISRDRWWSWMDVVLGGVVVALIGWFLFRWVRRRASVKAEQKAG